MSLDDQKVKAMTQAVFDQDEERLESLKAYFYSKLESNFRQYKVSGGFDYIEDTFLLLMNEIAQLRAQVRLCRDLVAGLSPDASVKVQKLVALADLPAEMAAPTRITYTPAQTPPGPGLGGLEADDIGEFRWILGDGFWIFSTRVRYERSLRIEIAVRPLTNGITVNDFTLSVSGAMVPLRYEEGGKLIAEFTDQSPFHFSSMQLKVAPQKYYEVPGDTRKFTVRITRVDIISDLDEAYASTADGVDDPSNV